MVSESSLEGQDFIKHSNMTEVPKGSIGKVFSFF